MYSAALCRGLIEASSAAGLRTRPSSYSAALCRGLIEAAWARRRTCRRASGIPRLYAAASLKLVEARIDALGDAQVFRGFMPRPH